MESFSLGNKKYFCATKNTKLIDAVLDRIESWKPKQRFTMELLEEEVALFDSFLKKEIAPPATVHDQQKDEDQILTQ